MKESFADVKRWQVKPDSERCQQMLPCHSPLWQEKGLGSNPAPTQTQRDGEPLLAPSAWEESENQLLKQRENTSPENRM